MKYFENHMIVLVLCLVLSQSLFGQTKVEVLTKTVEKSFAYIPGHTIKILGESARINVTSWERNEVKVVLKLISKGLTKADAERELTYQKYLIKDFDDEHVIKNFLLVPNELKELASIQETEIMVMVPGASNLRIENQYGEITLFGVSGKVEIASEYGNTEVNELTGAFEVESNFGDLLVQDCSGKMKLSLYLTKTVIDQFDGRGIVKSNLGDLLLKKPSKDSDIKVNSIKSDVQVEVLAVKDYRWLIKSKYGALTGPEFLLKHNTSKNNVKLEYGEASESTLNINTDFGEIEIIEL